MAIDTLQSLIDLDTPDNLELVRERIAEILFTEQQAQQDKARAAGKDPDPWALRLFVEASNCWGMLQPTNEGEDDGASIDTTPIVNICFDRTEYDRKRSLPAVRQQADATYYVDIYATATSRETSTGHEPGDLAARVLVQRTYGYVRRILMAGINANLQMLGTVGDVWPDSFEMYRVDKSDLDKGHSENIAFGRLKLDVSFIEFAPEYVGEALTELFVGVKRKETGELYFSAKTIGS